MEYRDLMKKPDLRKLWQRSLTNELGCLAQGIQDIKGTNTIYFIPKSDIPHDRRKEITYGRIVVAYKPDKLEKQRTRLTVGGDRLKCLIDPGTPTADVPTIKLLWNSTLSTPGAKYMTMDISNFYLGTPMERPEYMRMPLKIIPQEIIDHYNLEKIATDGWVYQKIVRGMYGLPIAGKIANDLLTKRISIAGYHPCQFTPGLWKHVWRPITFTLVVDDFGVKFVGKHHAQHLQETLKEHYDITVDWTGEKYVGISLKWDYNKRTLDISMPGYVNEARKRFGHKDPKQPVYGPSKFIPPVYGKKIQSEEIDTSAPMTSEETKRLEQLCGVFLYYGRAVDPTMMHILNVLASQQSKGTTQTTKQMEHFLNYCATCPDAKIRYCASDMKLWIHSDASYLNEPEGKSRYGGYHFLGSNGEQTINNAPILAIAKILKNVMSSAAESELGAIFHNAKEGVAERITLEEMGHPQGKTTIVSDNATAIGITNRTVKHKRSKAMAMRFYWVRDREAQGQFRFIWAPGKNNKADYFTKHHPAKHHRTERPMVMNTIQE